MLLCLAAQSFVHGSFTRVQGVHSSSSKSGTRVVLSQEGHYSIVSSYLTSQTWILSGELGSNVTNIRESKARDSIGAFEEVRFDWLNGLRSSIRTYDDDPVVRFSTRYLKEVKGSGVVFPRFASFPEQLNHFSY